MADPRPPMGPGPDWRIWFGLVLTIGWLLIGAIYIAQGQGWRFFTQPADVIGSFLEGAFAPLAFLWLVIGYFLQQKELSQNTEALRLQFREIQRSAEQAVIQSEHIARNEVHARQEAFLSIAESVRMQLGTIVGLLFISSQGAGEDGFVDNEQQGGLWAKLSQNDPEVFSRALLEIHVISNNEEARYALFYGTEVRARHCNNFIQTFDRLMKRAEEVDPDGMIRDALSTSAHGLVFLLAQRYRERAPEELANAERTGVHIDF